MVTTYQNCDVVGVVGESVCIERQRRAQAPHGVGRLVIVELELNHQNGIIFNDIEGISSKV
jgi:hypothetical protein